MKIVLALCYKGADILYHGLERHRFYDLKPFTDHPFAQCCTSLIC